MASLIAKFLDISYAFFSVNSRLPIETNIYLEFSFKI
jgi:hypothetical protein